MSDIEMLHTLEDLKTEKEHLELENMVFERFLQKNDPLLITGLCIHILKFSNKIHTDTIPFLFFSQGWLKLST